MTKQLLTICLALSMAGVVAAETITVNPSSTYVKPQVSSLNVDMTATGNKNTTYQWRLTASDGTKTFVLDSGNRDTDANGKIALWSFKQSPTVLTQGKKYTFTASLYKKGDDPNKAKPLATASKDHTIADK